MCVREREREREKRELEKERTSEKESHREKDKETLYVRVCVCECERDEKEHVKESSSRELLSFSWQLEQSIVEQICKTNRPMQQIVAAFSTHLITHVCAHVSRALDTSKCSLEVGSLESNRSFLLSKLIAALHSYQIMLCKILPNGQVCGRSKKEGGRYLWERIHMGRRTQSKCGVRAIREEPWEGKARDGRARGAHPSLRTHKVRTERRKKRWFCTH